MEYSDIVVVGGGPAGLSAAAAASKYGAKVTLFERMDALGGQLIKQTHKFFGSEQEHAGERGIHISKMLSLQMKGEKAIDIRVNAAVIGIYQDGIIAYVKDGVYGTILAEKVIVATGACERMLPFVKNDLPGVYGAGAVQTMMNLYGVKPGEEILMVGAGNIGLIVTYQLLQAGVRVAAVIDAAAVIGGYLVHAAKIRRMGVPIYTGCTIVEAVGENCVTGAVLQEVDKDFQLIENTKKAIPVDAISLAVGLSPLRELLKQAGCLLKYIPALGGFVPLRNENLETSRKGIYVAGDLSCIEEASSAMIEGGIAGLSALYDIECFPKEEIEKERAELKKELRILRSGAIGRKIEKNLELAML